MTGFLFIVKGTPMNTSSLPVIPALTEAQLAQVTGGHLPGMILDTVVKVVIATPK